MSLAKKVSTAFSQEHEVGVKWKIQRGWRVEPLPHLGVLVGGVVVEDRRGSPCRPARSRSTALRKRMNSWCRWRCMHWPMTVPSSTLSAANRVVVPLRL